MAFQTIKLSDELLAKLGATPADFADKLTALLASSDADKAALSQAQASATATATASAELLTRLAAVEANVAALQKAPGLDREEIIKAAEAKASATASAILAKGGGAPLPTASTAANDAAANGATDEVAQFRALLKAKQDAGKSKAAALAEAVKEKPALYAAYRAAGFGQL